jgi:demethylmenaquinone methyltransferase/2-methoxy-6-polyprenyl-1,4-benzoquinol methylase
VFSGHFYGHLDEAQRAEFVRVARTLAGELVIVDSASRPERPDETWEERVLNDGSRHSVYKRRFTADALAAELGGGETLHAGPWFVAVRSG